jgi:site-specific DNA recombinase
VQVGIRGLIGSMYLTDLGHKVRRGQSARVAAGKNPGGRIYGYKPVRGEPGEIEIDEAEAAIVARIFANMPTANQH